MTALANNATVGFAQAARWCVRDRNTLLSAVISSDGLIFVACNRICNGEIHWGPVMGFYQCRWDEVGSGKLQSFFYSAKVFTSRRWSLALIYTFKLQCISELTQNLVPPFGVVTSMTTSKTALQNTCWFVRAKCDVSCSLRVGFLAWSAMQNF